MGLNLKGKISFDNREVVKKAKESKDAVREFTKTSEGLVDQFAGLFGVSLSGIQNSVKAFRGGIISLSGANNTAAASTGLFSGALKVLKVALASTGIGAIVVALGSLIAYFTQSQDGADKLARILEPLKVLFAILTDAAASLGRGIVEAFTNPKEAIQGLWDFIKNQFINRLQGLTSTFVGLGRLIENVFKFDKEGIKSAAKDIQNSVTQTLTGLTEIERKQISESIKNKKNEVAEKLRLSRELKEREQKLEDEKISFITKRAELEKRIAEAQRKSRDEESLSLQQREQAGREAIALTNQLYAEEKRLRQEAFEIAKGQADLSENMRADNERLAQLQADIINADRQREDATRSLLRIQNTLTKQVEKERQEKELIQKLEQRRLETPLPPVNEIKGPDLKVNIKFPTSQEILDSAQGSINALPEIEKQFIDFGGVLSSGISTFAESLGELAASGDLGAFADSILSNFGGLIKQLGQMVLQLGIGLLAAKKSLETLNPFIAIAAGAALIAIGSAFASSTKKLGGSIAGSGQVGGGTINTTGSAGIQNTERQKLEVVVSGELRARGNTLVGVLSNENRRLSLTT